MMLPQVARLTSLDVYRDGGSISASFQGTDGDSYTLFFKIHRGWVDSLPAKYEAPVLDRYTPTENKIPITGVADPTWAKQSGPVSWPDARILLDELTPHFAGFSSEYQWVFGRMVAAANGDGDPFAKAIAS
jgi:hypothetical protein